jgi:hypothetical protein
MTARFLKNVGINKKFNEDGTFRRFPGNTIICDLSNHETLNKEIRWLQEQYEKLPFSVKFARLPLSSVHMTVIDLVCDYNRTAKSWSDLADINMPLKDVDRLFADQLSTIAAPENLTMKVTGVTRSSVQVSPVGGSNEAIHQFRDEVARRTGVRHPNHNTYKFHISFAYQIMETTPEEDEQMQELLLKAHERIVRLDPIQTGKPLFTLFESMAEYVPYTKETRALIQAQ